MLHSFVGDVMPTLGQIPGWMSSSWFLLEVLIGFSLIIFVHELGHFVAAKWAGVRVEKFAIGFGKELFGFTKGETRYSFNLLPLGGYVKMLGQEDFVVDKSGELKVKEDPDAFTNKSVGKRMVIVTAGVVMNLVFAAVAFTIVAMIGLEQMPPVVGYVSENSPAARAGIQAGDRILEINGDKVDNFFHLSALVSLSDEAEELRLKVLRGGEVVDPYPVLTPEYVENEKIRQIGVGPGWNRRVALAGMLSSQEPGPNDLRQNDELYKLAGGEGKALSDIGGFLRAVIAAEGEPVDVIVKRPKAADALTDEQLLAYDPADIEATEVRVQIQPVWNPLPYDKGKEVTGSLLGLVPRMTVLAVDSDKSFDKAGVLSGDVITRIGNQEYPTYGELKTTIQQNADQDVAIAVRRRRAANHELSAEMVTFCVVNREAIIAAALTDPVNAPKTVEELAKAQGVAQNELDKLLKTLGPLPTKSEWRKWFQQVDVHTLDPIVPTEPFALWNSPPPKIDARLRCDDEQRLVVADVVERFGDRPTPAREAGIPRGAIILSVDGRPVEKWYQLCNVFRAKAGRTVDVRYRLLDEYHTARLKIPQSVQTALGLGRGDRVVKIDGKSYYAHEDEDGNVRKTRLPDWRAMRTLLAESIGKTVEIEYVTLDGENKAGQYTVTADNIDPWPDRTNYSLTFTCYRLLERHSTSNPFAAFATGVRHAHRATMQTISTIRHMLFSGNVGLEKASGPVGILRIGSQVAESGPLELLWLLGFLSANLAVINFLPLPIVDGGLFLFLLLEKIRGEPVSIKTQVATQLIGIALIATVFLLVTYQDIVKWFTGA